MRVAKSLFLFGVTALAALTSTAFADEKEIPPYYCESDADCEKKYPDTVCIGVDMGGEEIKKCTPNTKTRPACRGGQPGLCPSYQSETQGYLNAHCIFVAEDGEEDDAGATDTTDKTDTTDMTDKTDEETTPAPSKTTAGGTATTTPAPSKTPASSAAALAFEDGADAEPTEKPKKASRVLATTSKSASASASGDSSGAGTPKPAAEGAAKNNGKTAKVKIGKQWMTGKFICVDISDCENKAADPTTCQPKECGSPQSLQQCSYQGTCTYGSIQTMKRKCICYKGFSGEKCQQEVSDECDVDCGPGGDCKDGKCTCKAGWNGKKPSGYTKPVGKPSKRCAKCTSDNACENDNPCNTETGKCDCRPGYFGPVCGGTEDSCVKKDCGQGTCQVAENGTSACYCQQCEPDCIPCKDKKCTTCPSTASTTDFSKLAMFVSTVLGLFVANLAL